MKNTLYDVLEVSSSASPEAIQAAFERLRAAHLADLDRGEGGPENVARFNLVKEAYQVLSSPQARASYDAKTLGDEDGDVYLVEEASSRPWVKVAMVALVVIAGGFYLNANSNEKAAIARVEAEKQRIEAEAAAQQRKFDLLADREEEYRLAREARQQSLEERRQRAEQERAMRDAERYAAQSERAERDAKRAAERAERDAQREEERKRREAEREARQQQYDAQRRIEQEKRIAREMEYERAAGGPKAGSIPPR